MLQFRTMGQRVLAGSFLGLLLGLSGLAGFAVFRLSDRQGELTAARADSSLRELRAAFAADLARGRGALAALSVALAADSLTPGEVQEALSMLLSAEPTLAAAHFFAASTSSPLSTSVSRDKDGAPKRLESAHEIDLAVSAPKPSFVAPERSFVLGGDQRSIDLAMDVPGRPGHRVAVSIDRARWRTSSERIGIDALGTEWALCLKERVLESRPQGFKPDFDRDWRDLAGAVPERGLQIVADETLLVGLPIALCETTEARLVARLPRFAYGDARKDQGLIAVIALLGLGAGLTGAALFVRPLVRRLRRTSERLADIAHGDHDLTVKLDLDGHGEVAQLGRNFDRFVEQIRELIQGIAETAAALDENTEDIETKTKALRSHCQSSREAAERTTNASTDVAMNLANAEREVSAMSDNFLSITEDLQRSTTSARHAAHVATDNAKTIQSLGERSNEIDQFVEVINGIAEQTNLLALNATIEAARAGESGKGFAVVANEVKTLAKEAADASETIRSRIEAIQAEIQQAVQGSESIDLAIKEVNEISNRIAEAVRSQAMVTTTINNALAHANRSVLSITAAAETAEHTAALNEQEAKQASATAMEVATISANLRLMIDEFRY